MPKQADGKAWDATPCTCSGRTTTTTVGVDNGRAMVLLQRRGRSFTDKSNDDADDIQPHGMHPDQHSIVTNPRTAASSSRRAMARSCGRTASGSTTAATARPSGA